MSSCCESKEVAGNAAVELIVHFEKRKTNAHKQTTKKKDGEKRVVGDARRPKGRVTAARQKAVRLERRCLAAEWAAAIWALA